MDSGNSGSLQSSSGGDANTVTGVSAADEVYDSRQESLFLNPSIHFNHLPLQPPSSSTFFDPTSYSQPINQNPNPNPMYNLESLWTRNTNPNQNPIYNLDTHQDPNYNPNPNPNANPHPKPNPNHINPDTGPEKGKNPKKRTRASRRAPTTVLTTDTTNFRQMVQEFTGIPAAPFSTATSSPFSRRLDLSPVQRIQLQQHQPSYLNSANATSTSFHLPPQEIQGFSKQPFNLSNLSNLTTMQNQMFSFQSGSQTNHSQRETQRSEPASESSKRWRGENEHLMNFERGNGSNSNNQNVGVLSRNDGDQLQGNEDSWICPSD